MKAFTYGNAAGNLVAMSTMTFPFGQQVKRVVQADRQPKKAFVLGVYASAVHAQWIGPRKEKLVKALAVASEPNIFWDGREAEEIIRQIALPPGVGTLEPAADMFNGPSGRSLDQHFLAPLGLSRHESWLCDLVPHSCVNPQQQEAIEREYLPIAKAHGLPLPSVPEVPASLADDERRQEILGELRASQAPLLILLGDQPIKWFLSPLDASFRGKTLTDIRPYGRRHPANLNGLRVDVLPLVHPRQAARLGRSSQRWAEAHTEWLSTVSPMS